MVSKRSYTKQHLLYEPTYMKFKSFETEIFQTERDRRVGGDVWGEHPAGGR